MSIYKVLNRQTFSKGEYTLTPIRSQDRYHIMNWRNEQIYHLRQTEFLSRESQDIYFDSIVQELYDQDFPNQVLFSFLESGRCIGYGGLVHISWIDKNAEISFIMDTALEKDCFNKTWSVYLNLIEKVAFEELQLYKIYTYAYDVRPQLFETLINNKYSKEAVLEKHVLIDTDYKDVLIHSKFNPSKQ